MNIGHVYAVTALLSVLQLLLILNRTIRTKYRETIDRDFCNLLLFFLTFCIVDALWGFCDARGSLVTPWLFKIVTFLYHTMSGLSAFMWFGYIMKYLNANGNMRKYGDLTRFLLIVWQISMIVSNNFNHQAFYIDDDLNYMTGNLRIWLYMAQYSYYILILVNSICFIFLKSGEKKRKHVNVVVFTLIPFCFGIGQFLFYNVAMYSMGFMLSAFIIYAYNLTDIRENHLESIARKNSEDALYDVMTGFRNRRCFENDLASYPSGCPSEQDFVFISMDLNGLKNVNDTLGHDAGDELIMGAASCMKQCFGNYGRLYRLGGDEFVAIIFSGKEKLEKIMIDFEETTLKWKGNKVGCLNVSCGYVTKREAPDMSFLDMSKLADKRMYREKEKYYATKGGDRRGQTEAYMAVCQLYKKILKINITTDTYKIIIMDENEKKESMGFSKKISTWLHDFGIIGQVHEDDLLNYLEKTSIGYLRNYFAAGKSSICIPYRRKVNDKYLNTIMEMIPAKDYDENNQSLFLYVKVLG